MARWFVDRSAQRGIPSVSLRSLLPEADFSGVSDLLVSGLSADSRRLEPGEVFVALRGRRHDGHDFVSRALDRGAAALIVERPCPEAGRLQVVVPDARAALARVANALAGDPSRAMRVVGVTGGPGRWAAAWFLRAILVAEGGRVGWYGPSGWSDGVTTYPARPGEPDAVELAGMLGRMAERRCESAVVCLDPESLAARVGEALSLAAVLVADLDAFGPESGLIAEARRAVARLVRRVEPGGSVVLDADERGQAVLAAVNLDAHWLTFGRRERGDVRAEVESLGPEGSRLTLQGLDRPATIRLRPVGGRASAAALAASAAAGAIGIDLDAVAAGLESVARVPGRLEPLPDASRGFACFEHVRSDGELAAALADLRVSGFGRVHAIVAVGSDTEPRGLAALARAAESGAEQVVATLDPRPRRDPDNFLDAFLAGFRRPGRVRVEPDLALAYRTTLALARPGDAVLLARPSARPTMSAVASPRPQATRPAPPFRRTA